MTSSTQGFGSSQGPEVSDDFEMVEPMTPTCKDLEVLVIKKIIGGGMLDQWNLHHTEADVKPGDFIDAVNGANGILGMQRELRCPCVTMDIVRYPELFTVQLNKVDLWGGEASCKLGFKFRRPGRGKAPELNNVEITRSGLLVEANRRYADDGRHHMVVRPGFRIQAVNDDEGDVDAMIEELMGPGDEDGYLRLRIRRVGAQEAMPSPKKALSSSTGAKGKALHDNGKGHVASKLKKAATADGRNVRVGLNNSNAKIVQEANLRGSRTFGEAIPLPSRSYQQSAPQGEQQQASLARKTFPLPGAREASLHGTSPSAREAPATPSQSSGGYPQPNQPAKRRLTGRGI